MEQSAALATTSLSTIKCADPSVASSAKYRASSPEDVQSWVNMYVNGTLNWSELAVAGVGGTDVVGVVTGTFEPRFDPSTRTATTSSATGTAMPIASAAIRLFLDFPSLYWSKRVSLCGVFVLDIS